MTTFSRSSIKALAVLTVICVPLLAYQSVRDKSAGAGEPEIAAANPVSAQSWTALQNIKAARFESTAIQYRDDIYVFNGFGVGINIEPKVEKFDAGTQTWSVIGNASVAQGTAVTHNGAILNGNEVWIIGGRVGDHPGAVTSKVWKFNLITHQWSAGPKMPVPVAAGGAALVDNRIHWFGGLDPNAQCDVSNHYVYDLDNPSAGWSDISGIAPMPIPRNHFGTVVHEGLIYAIGGQFTHDGCGAGTPDTNLVHVFDPETNNWSQLSSLPAIQSHIEPSTFAHQGAIYVVGGATNGNKVYRYDPSTDDWDTVALLPKALLAPIARVIDDQLIVSSGGGQGFIPSVATYATDITPMLLPDAGNTVIADTTPDPAPDTTDEHGLVSLEAEYHDNLSRTATHQWIPVNLAGASSNGAMTTTPNNKSIAHGSQGSPSMAYFAYFDRPGTWYLWVRGWGDTVNGEGGNDSLHAGLNGTLSKTADKIDNFPPGWNWTSSTRDNVRAKLTIPSAGIHAVNLWMREDGLAVDKILLTTDANYQPSGLGDAPSDNGSEETSHYAENETSTGVTVGTTTQSSSTDSTADNSPADNSTDASSDSNGNTASNTTQDSTSTDSTSDNSESTADVQSSNGIIAIEVENFDTKTSASNKQWIRSAKSGASGSASMVTSPNTGVLKSGKQGSPAMNYKVYFNDPGTYTVWLRGWGDTVGKEGKNDSVHVGINGTLGSAAAIQNFPAQWNWSSEKRSGGAENLNDH